MKRIFLNTLAAGAGLVVAVGAITAAAAPLKGQELASHAKITLEQARAIALKTRPGQIVDQELEKEGGGSGLRYAFDIKTGKTTFEVGVDAATGQVLENGAETAAQEASEAKADHKGHKEGHEGKERPEADEH
jgi:hypothetical protein